MSERVRPFEQGDAADVGDLDALMRAATAPARGGQAWLLEYPPTDWAALGVRSAGHQVWVAEYEQLVVGFLHLIVSGDVASVRQVYVRPEARTLGLGDMLLAAAVAHARSQGCTRVDAIALPGDRDTKNLYERAGVVARAIVLSVGLSEPASSADASR